jgi:hypothetical protein
VLLHYADEAPAYQHFIRDGGFVGEALSRITRRKTGA